MQWRKSAQGIAELWFATAIRSLASHWEGFSMNLGGEMNRGETEIHILSSAWKKIKLFHKEFKRVGPSQIVSFGEEKKLQISCILF